MCYCANMPSKTDFNHGVVSAISVPDVPTQHCSAVEQKRSNLCDALSLIKHPARLHCIQFSCLGSLTMAVATLQLWLCAPTISVRQKKIPTCSLSNWI